MTTKFTPGPWTAFEAFQDPESHWSVGPRFKACIRVGGTTNAGNVIAIVCMGGDGATSSSGAAVDANARLIADAPAMYALLQKIVDHFQNPNMTRYLGPLHPSAIEDAKAILARHQS